MPTPGRRARRSPAAAGRTCRLKTPLDFYMVADHAEFMGVFNQMANPDSPLSKTELAKGVTSPDANVRLQTFAGILRDMSAGKSDPQLTDPALARTRLGRDHQGGGRQLRARQVHHLRRLRMDLESGEAQPAPRGGLPRHRSTCPTWRCRRSTPTIPRRLWKWMDEQRAKGSTLFAIPHNGNASDGRMFETVKFDGQPIDAAYNATRATNEPLYEITQIKGTSETHPDLSPNDEFAGFEQWDYTLSADYERPTHRKGSFVRQALLDGMSQAASGAGNPVQVRLHRRHRHPQRRGQPRGVQLHRQVRLREQRQGAADRRARRAGGPGPADPGVQLRRPRRRVGRRRTRARRSGTRCSARRPSRPRAR